MTSRHALLSVFFISCFLSSSVIKADTTPPFSVGMILPLTGNAADYGVSIRNCIELARQDRPELFTDIIFHYEDVGFDTKAAVTAFNKFADVNNVDLVFTWGLPFCKVLSPLVDIRRQPTVGICAGHDAQGDFQIRFKNPLEDLIRLLTEYLHARGAKRLGIVQADHAYLEAVLETLRQNLKPGQTLKVVDRYDTIQTDTRASITKLRKGGFDAIGVLLYPGQISQFYRQLREQHLVIPTFGSDFFESSSETGAAKGAMDGAIFASSGFHRQFAERYERLFKGSSQLAFGALAYEFALLVGDLFHGVKKPLSGAEVLAKFEQVPQRDGVAAGPYRFARTVQHGKYFSFPVAVKEIHGNGFRHILER